MTNETATKIAHLIGYADRGCKCCVNDLVAHANEMFPEFTWAVSTEDTIYEDIGGGLTEPRIPVEVKPK